MSKEWPLKKCFRIRLTMESDWHVGSGMGRPGNVDRLIARDSDDLPFVPAKTLGGIWRDACERLCYGLDEGQVGVWSRMVDLLFGSQPALGENDPTARHRDPTEVPLTSNVHIRSALIASPLREQLIGANRRLLRQALTFVKPGIKIDRRSGAAQTNMLRFEEMGRKGTILEAECQYTVDESLRPLASALLIASAKLVERLGSKRRRGAGRCRLEIIDANETKALDWLEKNETPSTWKTSQDVGWQQESGHMIPLEDPWVRVPLVLKLQGPLAVSYRTTGNVVETLDFVPGSYLLPHITRTFPQLRSGLGAGYAVVLPAYPEHEGERSQPVPLALFTPKDLENPLLPANSQRVINRLLQAEQPTEIQLKQLREGYISSQPKKIYKTPIVVRTHNTVDDQPQRPTENVGGVYTYEAISPSDHGSPVVLRSELRIRKSLADRLGANWWDSLSGQISLGRSKKDDYGLVRLDAEHPSVCSSSITNNSGELFVWLVSDTLIRNQRLRTEPTAACLAAALSRRLGVMLKVRGSSDGRLDEFVRIRRLDTWHVGWGLPRPSLVALQAGSCMVFQFEGTIDPAILAQLEAGGIGERTAEGYGQLQFNHPLITAQRTWDVDVTNQLRAAPEPKSTLSIASSDHAFGFARLLERECWKQEIRRSCLEFANSAQNRKNELGWLAKGDQGQPPMSQLGGLRGQLAMLRTTRDRMKIIDWLDHLSGNNRRKDRWPSISKVKSLIESDSRIWDIVNTDRWPKITTNAETELKRDLWGLAVRTFFDACIRAHKRELEPEQLRKEDDSGA